MRTQVALRDLVPPTGLVPEYIKAVSRLCDAPGLYHVGALLSAMAAMVCPHAVGISRHGGRKRLEPLFLWVFLLGESGGRKTQAMIKAKDVVLCPDLLGPRVRSAYGSRAGLEKMLLEEPYPWVLIEEAPVWFRANRAAYMHDGAATWCEIYEGRLLRSNLVGSPEHNASDDPPEVRVSLLATGATPKVMRATRPDDWDSGLLARVMILTADPPQERPGPYSWSAQTRDRFRGRLLEMSELAKTSGHAVLADDARELWDGWLLDLGARCRGIHDTHAIMLRRLSSFALRISYLYAFSRGSIRASLDDMQRALALADLSRDCVLALDLS